VRAYLKLELRPLYAKEELELAKVY